MKRILIILILLFSIDHDCTAQYTDSIIEYYDYNWKKLEDKKTPYVFYRRARKTIEGTWHVQDYYRHANVLQMEGMFLDDSMTIQDGDFFYYHYNAAVAQTGRYHKGVKVGLWRSYGVNGMLLDSTRFKSTGFPYHKSFQWDETGRPTGYGEYDMAGTGEGFHIEYYEDSTISSYRKYTKGHLEDSIWTYYHRNGQPSMILTYDKGTVIKFDCYEEDGSVSKNCDTTLRMPEPGYNVNQFLGEHIKMPRVAMDVGLRGQYRVVIKFIVGLDGSITNVDIAQGSYAEFNEEALRVAKQMPKWKPGRCQNRNVRVYYSLPINFKLE